MLPPIKVVLDLPLRQRWLLSPLHCTAAIELVEVFTEEIGNSKICKELAVKLLPKIPKQIITELYDVATKCSIPKEELLYANLHYEFVKTLLGCTAFAVDTPSGPIHARNMDWYSKDNCLAKLTSVVSFQNTNGFSFESIGWPGFFGVFSGIAKGRFAITLNAALSNRPQVVGTPIAFLLRDVLEKCHDFESAVERLSTERICSDCLILISGTNSGEMFVIERTPNKFAIGQPSSGRIVVTNHFSTLLQDNSSSDSLIYNTTCSRHDATNSLINGKRNLSVEDCFRILSHPDVRLSVTVQQMVFSAKSGLLHVRTSQRQ